MLMFLLSMISISFILMMSSHPVAILSAILAQTLLICLVLWFLLKTSWFSFILFLIFLGGLMVLFVYVVSLASNEKFEPNPPQIMSSLIILVSAIMIIFYASFFFKMNFSQANNFFNSNFLLFSSDIFFSTLLIMYYLLFTLIVAVKISSKYEGPLRNLM